MASEVEQTLEEGEEVSEVEPVEEALVDLVGRE